VKRRVVPFAPVLTSDGKDQAWPASEHVVKTLDELSLVGL
jgi:hypothetical protein